MYAPVPNTTGSSVDVPQVITRLRTSPLPVRSRLAGEEYPAKWMMVWLASVSRFSLELFVSSNRIDSVTRLNELFLSVTHPQAFLAHPVVFI